MHVAQAAMSTAREEPKGGLLTLAELARLVDLGEVDKAFAESAAVIEHEHIGVGEERARQGEAPFPKMAAASDQRR